MAVKRRGIYDAVHRSLDSMQPGTSRRFQAAIPAKEMVQPFANPRTGKPTFASPARGEGDRTLRTWQCGSSPATTDHRHTKPVLKSPDAFERGREKVCPLLAQDPFHSL